MPWEFTRRTTVISNHGDSLRIRLIMSSLRSAEFGTVIRTTVSHVQGQLGLNVVGILEGRPQPFLTHRHHASLGPKRFNTTWLWMKSVQI